MFDYIPFPVFTHTHTTGMTHFHRSCHFNSHSREWIMKAAAGIRGAEGSFLFLWKLKAHHRPCRRESSYCRSPSINFALSQHISSRYSVMLTDRHHVSLSSGLLHEAWSVPTRQGEVEPSVPCRRFAACKRSLNVRGSRHLGKIIGQFLAHSSTLRC